jgi:hypothetical protein
VAGHNRKEALHFKEKAWQLKQEKEEALDQLKTKQIALKK